MSRDLRYFLGYAAFREYRYRAHRRENEERRHPHTEESLGYAGWIAFWIVMSTLSVVWFSIFWGALFFMWLGLIWQAFTWIVTIAGLSEQYRLNHDK